MSSAGYELPLLLFAGFRSIIDELHAELARRGHQDMRPAHGFAMQAIGFSGATATEVGRRLGISKQAAGKTGQRLGAPGCVEGGGPGRARGWPARALAPEGPKPGRQRVDARPAVLVAGGLERGVRDPGRIADE